MEGIGSFFNLILLSENEPRLNGPGEGTAEKRGQNAMSII